MRLFPASVESAELLASTVPTGRFDMPVPRGDARNERIGFTGVAPAASPDAEAQRILVKVEDSASNIQQRVNLLESRVDSLEFRLQQVIDDIRDGTLRADSRPSAAYIPSDAVYPS